MLVVEDEPMIRMLAVDMLDELGWAAVEAGAAAEALELMGGKGDNLRAAIVDLGLPDRPGEELVREMRRLKPELPVIVTTGRSEGDLDQGLRSDRSVVYLGKPYQLADLEAALNALQLAH
jgi:DNA-binding response OmpR family regulator